MPRPKDGLCAHCHRNLPPEFVRGWLTQGTDQCWKCGHARSAKAAKTKAGAAYFAAWPHVLDTHLRVVARVKAR